MTPQALQKRAYNVAELRLIAKRRLPKALFDFTDGGAEDELATRRNEGDFDDIDLFPRMLRATPNRDQSIEIFGEKLKLPILIPPTGLSGALWPKGEIQSSRAAAAAGTIFCLSHGSTCSLEEVAAASTGPKWMQVFMYKDRAITQDLAERAQAAGYKALVLTVDCQTHGQRERDIRNGFTVPPRVTLANSFDMLKRLPWLMQMGPLMPSLTFKNYEPYVDKRGVVPLSQAMGNLIDANVGWDDFSWLRSVWNGPLLLKGILHADDARRALELGANGLYVSNHGGRQLDGTPSSIAALPAIADAVGGKMVILLDGGVRRGTDVLKTLALGANAVCIGRPQLWGLAAGGQAGVEWVLELLRREVDRALALGGWDSLNEVNRDAVRLRAPRCAG